MHLHTEDDLYYVQNYSIWLDIQIIIRTVWIVLRGKGAY
jgi:lipopolysaccharide/colanic/teichoic acid biosynthesis glycosyltransferase